MITIYKVQEYDCEGKHPFGKPLYFVDKQDAYRAAGFNESGIRLDAMNTNQCDEIKVWEKSEYTRENILRQQALSKLTEAEKRVLGL